MANGNIVTKREELQRRQKVLLEELIRISAELISIKQDELHYDMNIQISLLELKKRISY